MKSRTEYSLAAPSGSTIRERITASRTPTNSVSTSNAESHIPPLLLTIVAYKRYSSYMYTTISVTDTHSSDQITHKTSKHSKHHEGPPQNQFRIVKSAKQIIINNIVRVFSAVERKKPF